MRGASIVRSILVGIVVAGACASPRPEPARGEAVRQECPPRPSDDFFFPPGIIAVDPEHDSSQRRAYSRSFRLAGAPSLSCGPFPAEAYRLQHWIYFRGTFIITVTVGRDGRDWEVEGIELSADAYPPVRVVRRIQRPIGGGEGEALREA